MRIEEIRQAASETGGAMRWPEAEAHAVEFITAILVEVHKLELSWLAWMPEEVSFQQARGKAAVNHGHSCGCGECSKERAKRFTESSIMEILMALARFVGSDRAIYLAGLFDSAAAAAGAIFINEIKKALQVGADRGYADIVQVARTDRDVRAALRAPAKAALKPALKLIPEVLEVNYAEAYASEVIDSGFNTITYSISKKFKAEAMQIMVDGLRDGKSWQEIASIMHRSIGMGDTSHWKRLVRTEMLKAYDRAAKDRYAKAGATYVKFLPVMNPCPICAELSKTNKGYYPMATAPKLPDETHPNCRCKWVPVWNLPAGVDI
jgi:hypothetical protein